MMNFRKFALFAALLAICRLSHGQASPTAAEGRSYQVGGAFSAAKPDYNTKWITGISGFADMNLGRHLGVEVDVHDTNLGTPQDVGEVSYLGGVRYRARFGRFHPYAKVLFGAGTFSEHVGYYPQNVSETFKVFSFGGGVEYPLTRRWNLRAIDGEYQMWPAFGGNGLDPFVLSSGVAYRF